MDAFASACFLSFNWLRKEGNSIVRNFRRNNLGADAVLMLMESLFAEDPSENQQLTVFMRACVQRGLVDPGRLKLASARGRLQEQLLQGVDLSCNAAIIPKRDDGIQYNCNLFEGLVQFKNSLTRLYLRNTDLGALTTTGGTCYRPGGDRKKKDQGPDPHW